MGRSGCDTTSATTGSAVEAQTQALISQPQRASCREGRGSEGRGSEPRRAAMIMAFDAKKAIARLRISRRISQLSGCAYGPPTAAGPGAALRRHARGTQARSAWPAARAVAMPQRR